MRRIIEEGASLMAFMLFICLCILMFVVVVLGIGGLIDFIERQC